MDATDVGFICRIDDVPDGDARGFDVSDADGGHLPVIVVRRGDAVFAYRNRCPHRGTPLDWHPDRFLDASGKHLICATHGALFRFEDGFCLAGPCHGDSLTQVPIIVESGQVRRQPR